MEFNSFGPAVGRLGSDSSRGGLKSKQGADPPSPPHFNHWLWGYWGNSNNISKKEDICINEALFEFLSCVDQRIWLVRNPQMLSTICWHFTWTEYTFDLFRCHENLMIGPSLSLFWLLSLLRLSILCELFCCHYFRGSESSWKTISLQILLRWSVCIVATCICCRCSLCEQLHIKS